MKKRMILLLILLVALTWTVMATADDEQQKESTWPENLPLPKYKLPHEKLVPPEPMDDVTPPPPEPVRCVAEFEYQEGVQLAYPFGWDNIFVEMVRACEDVGVVYIVVENTATMSECTNLLLANGVPVDNIEYMYHPINAMWSRDYGAHFVWGETSGEISLVDWQYYDSRPNDDEIPDFQADQWHMNFYETPMYHEGGNYMSDGHGTVMCSTVLYDDNPSWSHAQCIQELINYYGASDVYVYQKISQDATGHIDLWAKMLNDTTVLVAQMQPGDPNYALVEQHAAAIAQVPTIYGTPFEVVRCPMPSLYYWWIFPYYKSFLNSLIFNGKVLVPIYATEPAMTQQALAAYQAAMPDYEVVGIYCDDIAYAGGAIHCTTIGIADHIDDYVHNADVTLTPINPPIVIPPSGGSFSYTASLHNNETDSIYTEVWVEVELPNGNIYGPVIHKYVALPAGGTASRTLIQFVPGGAPPGTYTYTMYTGSRLPRVVNDESSFTFVKSGSDGEFSGDMTGWWTDEVSGTVEIATAVVPADFCVVNAYPNPFNPSTAISFKLQASSFVNLAVYDITGRQVAELVNGWRDAGRYDVTFDGSKLSSGMYIYRLETSEGMVSGKMVLMK